MNIEYESKHVCIIQYPSKGPVQYLTQNGHMNIRIFVRGRVNIIRWVGEAADRDLLESGSFFDSLFVSYN